MGPEISRWLWMDTRAMVTKMSLPRGRKSLKTDARRQHQWKCLASMPCSLSLQGSSLASHPAGHLCSYWQAQCTLGRCGGCSIFKVPLRAWWTWKPMIRNTVVCYLSCRTVKVMPKVMFSADNSGGVSFFSLLIRIPLIDNSNLSLSSTYCEICIVSMDFSAYFTVSQGPRETPKW